MAYEDTTPEDLIGQRLFNPTRYMGLGVVTDVTTRRNARGESQRVFVCETPKGSTVDREVDKILRQLQDESSLQAFDIGEIFDESPEDYDLAATAELTP